MPILFLLCYNKLNNEAEGKMKIITELECKKRYDIIVCGGGLAGVAAAVTAARRGKSVLLLEKSNILGGYCHPAGAIGAGGSYYDPFPR